MNQLPEGWSKASLSDLVTHSLGGDWGKDTREDDGYVKVKVIRGTDFKSWRRVKGREAAERWVKNSSLEKRRLLSGNIVAEVSGGGPSQPVGRTVLIDESVLQQTDSPMICSNFFRQIRLSEIVDPAFVNHFLSYAYSEGAFDQYQTQTTNLRNLNFPHFLGAEIRVPPLAEQRRIVVKLEAMLGKVEACQKRFARIVAILKRFRQSVLTAAYCGRLTADWRDNQRQSQSLGHFLESLRVQRKEVWQSNQRDEPKRSYHEAVSFDANDLPVIPDTWELTSADFVCSQITDGEHIQPPYHSEGRPMLTAKHVRDGYVTFDNAGYIKEADFRKCLERCAPNNGDILIVSVGATTGRAAIVEDCPPFAIVRSVLLLKPLIGSLYLLRWIQSPWCFNWMTQASGASAQPHLYIKDTKRMPVPIAPLAEQQEIIRRVEALFKCADQIEAGYQQAKAQVDKLAQSILAKAFQGELVPTEAEIARRDGRDYEPASVLLQRIRTGRDNEATGSASTRANRSKERRPGKQPGRRK